MLGKSVYLSDVQAKETVLVVSIKKEMKKIRTNDWKQNLIGDFLEKQLLFWVV